MRADEIRELTLTDIRSRVSELEEERFRLKFRSATEQLEDPLRLRWIRKDIARLQTILREKEQQQETQEPKAAAASAGAKNTKKTAKKTTARTKRARRTAR